MKKILSWLIAGAILFIFNTGFHAGYQPSDFVTWLQWQIIYPCLVISFGYFYFIPENSIAERKRKDYKARGVSSLVFPIESFFAVLLAPAFLILLSTTVLGFFSDIYAREKFTEVAYVKEVDCSSGVRINYFDLTVTYQDHQEKITFPYFMCRDKPYIYRLEKEKIKLHGRKNKLGKIYDGFEYPANLNLVSASPLYLPTLDDTLKEAKTVAYIEPESQNALLRGIGVMHDLANKNDLEATYNLGLAYLNGIGVKVDKTLANTYFQQAASGGYPDAQFQVALSYYEGAPKIDYANARQWFLKAAQSGHAQSQFYLGEIYRLGLGVKKNNEEAVKWYRKSALGGSAQGQYMYAVSCYAGIAGKVDDKEAKYWAQKSAGQGNSDAKELLDEMQKIYAQVQN